MLLNRKFFYTFFIFVCVVGYSWLYLNRKPYPNSFHATDVCLIKRIINIPCPSCGSTRAAELILNGDLKQSLFYNPLGVLLVVMLMMVPIWIAYDIILVKATLYQFYFKAEQIFNHPEIALPATFLMFANWIWNIAKGL